MLNTVQILNDPYADWDRLDYFKPWKLTGESPSNWLINNLDSYIFSKAQIIESALLYEVTDVTRDEGIYFLISEGEIVYVGISKDIETRIFQHIKNGFQFTHISWITWVPEIFLDTIEMYYIYEFSPPLNVKYPTPCYTFHEYAKKYPEKIKGMAIFKAMARY